MFPRVRLVLAVLLGGGALAAAWAARGGGRLDGVEVRSAVLAPLPAGGERGIAVEFSVPRSLAAVRAEQNLPYVRALLFACRAPEAYGAEVVTQRAEYFGDRGRVRPIGRGGASPVRYRALFDDRLTRLADHRFRDAPATRAGPLCFALGGGGEPRRFLAGPLPLPRLTS